MWDIKEHKELRQVNNKDNGHNGDVRRLLVINKGQYLLSAGLDGKVKLWKVSKKPEADVPLISLDDLDSKDIDLESKALEEILRGGPDVELESSQHADQLQMTMQAHDEDCYEMEVNPKFPLMCTSSSYNAVRIWKIDDLTAPELIFEFVGHTNSVSSLTMMDSDAQLLTSSTDYRVHLYDMRSSRRDTCYNFGGSVLSVAVTPDSRYAYVGGNDYDIKGYSVAGGKYDQVVKLVGHSGRVVAMAVSPDGGTLASGGHDFNICVWKLQADYPAPHPDPVTQRMSVHAITPAARVQAHEGHVLDLQFSSAVDGRTFMSSCGNDHGLKVWTMRGPGRVAQLWSKTDAHESAVSGTAFGRGPSAKMLYSCGWDAKIRAWNTESQDNPTAVATLRGHMGRVEAVEATKDGTRIISISADYTAMLWESMAGFACICVYRPLEVRVQTRTKEWHADAFSNTGEGQRQGRRQDGVGSVACLRNTIWP